MGIKLDTFRVVSDWIFAATGSRPYLLDSNFIKPEGQFIACKCMTIDASSWSSNHVPPDDETNDGRTEVYQYYLLSYLIRGFRAESYDIIFDLAHSLREPEMQYILNQGGLGYSDHSTPADQSIQIDSVTMEERASFTVFFYYAYNRSAVRGEAPGVIVDVNTIPTII